jgi:hypothetical protein
MALLSKLILLLWVVGAVGRSVAAACTEDSDCEVMEPGSLRYVPARVGAASHRTDLC